MTVLDIYDQTIKPLPADARLQLARMILDDLAPGEIRDRAQLEDMLLAGLDSGPGIESTSEYWQKKRTALITRQERKSKTA
jgi:hypothetical protein